MENERYQTVRANREHTKVIMTYAPKTRFVIEFGDVDALPKLNCAAYSIRSDAREFTKEDADRFDITLRALAPKPTSVHDFAKNVFEAYAAFERSEPCCAVHESWWERIERDGKRAFRFVFEDSKPWTHRVRLTRVANHLSDQKLSVNNSSTRMHHVVDTTAYPYVDVGDIDSMPVFESAPIASVPLVIDDVDRFQRCVPEGKPQNLKQALMYVRFAIEVYESGTTLVAQVPTRKWWIAYAGGVRFVYADDAVWSLTSILVKSQCFDF